MKKIKLTRGMFALVDDEDFEELNKWKWCTSKSRTTFYATRNHKKISIHRVIMKATKGVFVDHINGNGLDNRKKNLCLCTNQQNCFNQRIAKNNRSGYKGVHWDKDMKKYRGQITINKKHIDLGFFRNKIDAAKAYNKAAKIIFGDFACVNR